MSAHGGVRVECDNAYDDGNVYHLEHDHHQHVDDDVHTEDAD
jgi:hypothetical protein